MNICKICGKSSQLNEHTVKEMMFGMRAQFTYFECAYCGCLQIKNIPEEMSIYYRPYEYYSFKVSAQKIKLLWFKKLIVWIKMRCNLKIIRSADCLFGSKFKNYFQWLSYINGISYVSRVLDVGCGSGTLLTEMRELGFMRLNGVDPFIQASKNEECISINKSELKNVEGSYDLIMLHHSFEHIPDQDQAMRKLNKILVLGGSLLIRVPVADCYAWRTYGENWYQIDAPRHFYLHSSKSLTMLANKNGFNLVHSYRDSTELQFSISEMYAKDIASDKIDAKLLAVNIKANRKRAAVLNAQNDGDQACFIFKKYEDRLCEN